MLKIKKRFIQYGQNNHHQKRNRGSFEKND